MRLFVGVGLSGLAKAETLRIQSLLPKEGLRLVRPEKLHLTLAFLGKVEPPCLAPLMEALAGVPFVLSENSFVQTRPGRPSHGWPSHGIGLKLSELGAFPRLTKPKIVWIGIDGDVIRLGELAAVIVDTSRPFAPGMDLKAFTPHVTLARAKERIGPISQLAVQPVELRVDAFTLFESQPDGGYLELQTVPLIR